MFGKESKKDSKKDAGSSSEATVLPTSQPSSPTPPASPNQLQSRSTAMIGQSIKIKGTITGSENLVVEGSVEGSIDLPDNDLTVGETGQVTADLGAKNVRVDGQVTGDISGTEKVVISKSGRVRGNIIAPRVTLEDGAKFKGSIDMDPGEAARPQPKVASDSTADVASDTTLGAAKKAS